MIIIKKNFSGDYPYLTGDFKSVSELVDSQINKEKEQSFAFKKPHELTAVYAVDPAMKPAMIKADRNKDIKESGDKVLEILKNNNWKFTNMTGGNEKNSSDQNVSNSSNVEQEKPEKPQATPVSPVKSMTENSSDDDSGLSVGAKAGLITAGVAAAGAAGYGAYKALKNRRARKLEVEKSLENKYKISK